MKSAAALRVTHTDAQLLARVAAGEIGGLGTLFDRYAQDVRRFVARMGARDGDIDDLVQLTFLAVVRAAPSFDGRASAKSWLLGIATMILRRHRRALMRVADRLRAWATEPRVASEAPGRTFEIKEAATRAAEALAKLSGKKREVFVMVVLEGASGEDVARALEIPVATVWTRLHHARRDLREYLAQGGPWDA